MAKRGYTRETIRGAASEWDVSRPFSSYIRVLARLLVHPVRFFELLPKSPGYRAPALFLSFSGILSALLWLLVGGLTPAILALILPLPLSFLFAGLCHLGMWSSRYGYRGTWRTLAYPLGYLLPLTAVPGLRWVAVAYTGVILLPSGLQKVQEIYLARAALTSAAATILLLFGLWGFLRFA